MLLRWEQISGCIDSESGVLALVKAGGHQHQHVFANFTPTERCSGRLAVLPDELARLPEPQQAINTAYWLHIAAFYPEALIDCINHDRLAADSHASSQSHARYRRKVAIRCLPEYTVVPYSHILASVSYNLLHVHTADSLR